MNIKEKLKKQKVKGLFIKVMTHPAVVMMAQDEGMDFIFYDCEHGVMSYETLHDLMVFKNQNAFPSVVRVAQLARADISRILDYGASGVMVPMIENKEQAELLVQWSKYPPIGKRSYSGGANTNYAAGGNHKKHMEESNLRTMSIVQIETQEGVANIHEILSVEGIDAVIIGPCDLAISLHKPEQIMDEKELHMILEVAQACKLYDKAFGIIGNMELLTYFKDCIDILVAAIDVNLMRKGIKEAVCDYEAFIKDKELI